MKSLLFSEFVGVAKGIEVRLPTVGEVIENESEYYSQIFSITSMPIDMMVQLDDDGVDFTKIDEWDLFLGLFPWLQRQDTRLLFGNLDLSKFAPAINEKNNEIVLLDVENDIKIDRTVHSAIADTLRKIHSLEKNNKKPANEDARLYMIERARKKMARLKNKKSTSELEPLIITAVNTPEFKYDFETVKHMTIYQFNASIKQIINKVSFDKRMIGVYAGTIDTKDLSNDELTFIAKTNF